MKPRRWGLPEQEVYDHFQEVCLSNDELIKVIAYGLELRGYHPTVTRPANIVLRCQITPNSVFELGVGPGRPLGWRYTSGPHTDADKYFSEDVEQLFLDLRTLMKNIARREGMEDGSRFKDAPLKRSRWKGTEWEDVYEHEFQYQVRGFSTR